MNFYALMCKIIITLLVGFGLLWYVFPMYNEDSTLEVLFATLITAVVIGGIIKLWYKCTKK